MNIENILNSDNLLMLKTLNEQFNYQYSILIIIRDDFSFYAAKVTAIIKKNGIIYTVANHL